MPIHRVSFSYFDMLYQGQPDQFLDMLDLYVQEYVLYERIIRQSLQTGDEVEFRKVKHKIIYSLHLLGLDGLKAVLEETAVQISSMSLAHILQEQEQYEGIFQLIYQAIATKKLELAALPIQV